MTPPPRCKYPSCFYFLAPPGGQEVALCVCACVCACVRVCVCDFYEFFTLSSLNLNAVFQLSSSCHPAVIQLSSSCLSAVSQLSLSCLSAVSQHFLSSRLLSTSSLSLILREYFIQPAEHRILRLVFK